MSSKNKEDYWNNNQKLPPYLATFRYHFSSDEKSGIA